MQVGAWGLLIGAIGPGFRGFGLRLRGLGVTLGFRGISGDLSYCPWNKNPAILALYEGSRFSETSIINVQKLHVVLVGFLYTGKADSHALNQTNPSPPTHTSARRGCAGVPRATGASRGGPL